MTARAIGIGVIQVDTSLSGAVPDGPYHVMGGAGRLGT